MRLHDLSKKELNREASCDNSSVVYGINRGIIPNIRA